MTSQRVTKRGRPLWLLPRAAFVRLCIDTMMVFVRCRAVSLVIAEDAQVMNVLLKGNQKWIGFDLMIV